ncbi:MAG: ElaA protein [Nitrospirales bacterium]|nr:MAG: ElaA protein [Nitrospirales bacterium]
MTMSTIRWNVQTFDEFKAAQLFDVLHLRVNVFVVEQQCAYPELDDYDRHVDTKHVQGHDENGNLVAYARLLPAGLSFPEVSIGRFVVQKGRRGQGIGHQLLRTSLEMIAQCWSGRSIKISAQEYLKNFYAPYGFIQVSDMYLDAGVPHVDMLKKS